MLGSIFGVLVVLIFLWYCCIVVPRAPRPVRRLHSADSSESEMSEGHNAGMGKGGNRLVGPLSPCREAWSGARAASAPVPTHTADAGI